MEKMNVDLVIEVLGRPPENVTQAMQNLVTKIKSEKGVKLIENKIHEPVAVKDTPNLWTAFMEVSLEIDSLATYFYLIFTYMPSHIELVSPENISLTNFELNDLANSLTQRLHNYDAITKQVSMERDIVLRKLQEVAPHLFSKKEIEGMLPSIGIIKKNQENKKKLDKKKSKSKSSKNAKKKK